MHCCIGQINHWVPHYQNCSDTPSVWARKMLLQNENSSDHKTYLTCLEPCWTYCKSFKRHENLFQNALNTFNINITHSHLDFYSTIFSPVDDFIAEICSIEDFNVEGCFNPTNGRFSGVSFFSGDLSYCFCWKFLWFCCLDYYFNLYATLLKMQSAEMHLKMKLFH